MPLFGPALRLGEQLAANIPFLLIGFFILSMYSVIWEFAVQVLILGQVRYSHRIGTDTYEAPGHRVLGWVLLILGLFTKFSWLLAWLWMLWTTHLSRSRHRGPVSSPKREMHSDASEKTRLQHFRQPASNPNFGGASNRDAPILSATVTALTTARRLTDITPSMTTTATGCGW
jgi:hypothetical protein